eukprot:5019178-Pyramimonas_sp.AAC.1
MISDALFRISALSLATSHENGPIEATPTQGIPASSSAEPAPIPLLQDAAALTAGHGDSSSKLVGARRANPQAPPRRSRGVRQ